MSTVNREQLRERVLNIINLRTFRGWLRSNSLETVVGFNDDERKCPLANYANQQWQGEISNFQIDEQDCYIEDADGNRIVAVDTPYWINFFVAEVDKLAGTKASFIPGVPKMITVDECLYILNKL